MSTKGVIKRSLETKAYIQDVVFMCELLHKNITLPPDYWRHVNEIKRVGKWLLEDDNDQV